MLFTQPVFGFFFAAVIVLYWFVIRSNQPRKWLLLIASYIFYGAWDPRFLTLIIISTLVDHVVAGRIAGSDSTPVRRRWLLFSLGANLGMLGYFKYVGFFADSFASLVESLGGTASNVTLNVTLPVGISFFTFQTLSYTIDVYRGSLERRKSLLDLAVFVAFFPQLVAGPIVRAADFLPQLDVSHRLANVAWRPAITLFVIGFFKKAVLADTLGPQVDLVFSDPRAYDWFSVVLAVFGYAAQIYCDFSGYSDMAIATAAMLGFSLGENFRFPYLASTIDDFWRRWHISLSSWLRDYLYISLGGNRRGVRITYRNLLLTMVLGGLWHGAAWTFVAWGALHGTALAAHRAWSQRRAKAILAQPRGSVTDPSPTAPRTIAIRVSSTLATFLFVCLAWVFFRAPTFGDAATVLEELVGSGNGALQITRWVAVYLVAAVVLHLAAYRQVLVGRVAALTDTQYSLALGVVVVVVLALRPLGASPFIYFQF